jgi:predicted ester cyclase
VAIKETILMSTEQNKTFVLQMYGEFDTGNLDTLEEFTVPNFVTYVPGAPGPLDRDGFKQFLLTFYSAFPDGHHVFDEVIAEEDKVVTIGSFRGTHEGELQGIPPTGKQLKLSVIHVDRIEGGKLVEHRGVANIMDLMQQLGVVPARGEGGG